jgi:hypothetical protein
VYSRSPSRGREVGQGREGQWRLDFNSHGVALPSPERGRRETERPRLDLFLNNHKPNLRSRNQSSNGMDVQW